MNQHTNRLRPNGARAIAIPAPPPGTDIAGFGEFVKSLVDSMLAAMAQAAQERQQRRIERRAMAELGGLSNHQLKDLGIHRSEISSMVHGAQARTERRRHVEG